MRALTSLHLLFVSNKSGKEMAVKVGTTEFSGRNVPHAQGGFHIWFCISKQAAAAEKTGVRNVNAQRNFIEQIKRNG